MQWVSDIVTTLGQGQNSHNIQYLSQGGSHNIRYLLDTVRPAGHAGVRRTSTHVVPLQILLESRSYPAAGASRASDLVTSKECVIGVLDSSLGSESGVGFMAIFEF